MLSDLLDFNRQWAAARVSEDPDYFRRLAGVQHPEYLWIGCSDSRVPANVITGVQPGEVFVHRNVANLVHRGDLNLLSVVEYAVETLQVRHGIIDHWLQPIRDVAEANREELAGIADTEARYRRLCELTIAAQVESLSRTPIIQSAWHRGNPLAIHGWIYDLENGCLRDLSCTRTAAARTS